MLLSKAMFLLVDGTISALMILLGTVVLLDNPKPLTNRYFFALALSVGAWILTNHFSNDVTASIENALFFNHAVFFFALLSAVLLLAVVIEISGFKLSDFIKKINVALSPIVLAISFTPLVVADIRQEGSVYGIEFGSFAWLYFMFLAYTVVVLFYVLIKSPSIAEDHKEKAKLRLLSRNISAGLAIVMVTNMIAPIFFDAYAMTEIGTWPVIILVVSLVYSIAKHGLFDVRLAAMRTVGYALAILTMAIAYTMLAYAASLLFFGGGTTEGVSFSPINIALALAISFIFQPIKRFFDHLTDKIFYHGEYRQEEFFREFGRILSFDTDLRLLLRQASAFISKNLKSERVFFFIVGQGVFDQKGTSRRRILDVDINSILDYYRANYEPPELLTRDNVKDDNIKKILTIHSARLVVPLMFQDQPIGILFIGDHKSRGYLPRDVQVVESVVNELTIAVQNSLSVEEIRELNASLQHKVNIATKELRTTNRQLQKLDETKNEFISMASHQLRTPLTSIKGYLDMVLQGDLGKVSSTQRAVLSEAFISSERMVALINDFLNVSRLQTGKFTIDRSEADLSKVVREEVKMLSVLASQRDLKIKEKISKNIPRLNIDAEKLRQVIVNMIDNAIYYSKPGTTIQVSLINEGDQLVFKVKDTGIGVPEEEQSGLFGKFFRASNARRKRPDGTGVGLFLAKKVVVLHGGKTIFESRENRGSTFGFSLPIR